MSDLDQTASGVDTLVARAHAARRDGQPRQALATLLDVLEIDGDNAAGRFELALALEDIGHDGDSRAVLAILARDGDDSAGTWSRLGRRLLAEGHLATAEPCLRRALALDAATGPRLELAALLAAKGDAEAAADCYRALPAAAAALVGLGQALTALGRLDEAAEALAGALALDPDLASAKLARRNLALKQGDPVAAWRDAESR